MIILYGIPNCDTVKKARTFLEGRGIAYRFHDFRKDGLTAALASAMIAALGREQVVNRKGTTWRALDAVTQAGAETDEGAAALMVAYPALVKRPVWQKGGDWRLGFAPKDQDALGIWAAS